MDTKQKIVIKSHRKGKSQRCISRELQVSPKTVKRCIEAYEQIQKSGISLAKAQSVYLSTMLVY
ncbi:MAG: helix-turn-helix domain-containing protein [Bacteroidales bacterium]|jgi:transposase|nr:helix-turn-helix domain-containing protein [Bacteroidales bacterium]MDD3961673.1 helix-turn-helix domain-containing protein [Bacteroidales bacterium]